MLRGSRIALRLIRITVTSDFNCPWCWVGKRSLDAAIAATPSHSFEVSWLPYLLDSSLPLTGKDKVAHYRSKYGPDIQTRWGRLMGRLNKHGVEVNLVEGSILANATHAHRLSHYVGQQHGPALQHAVHEVVFRYNHRDGLNIGDLDVLVKAAEEAGLKDPKLRAYLASDEDRDMLKDLDSRNTARGVDGVPHFQIESKAVTEALEPHEFQQLFAEVIKS